MLLRFGWSSHRYSLESLPGHATFSMWARRRAFPCKRGPTSQPITFRAPCLSTSTSACTRRFTKLDSKSCAPLHRQLHPVSRGGSPIRKTVAGSTVWRITPHKSAWVSRCCRRRRGPGDSLPLPICAAASGGAGYLSRNPLPTNKTPTAGR